MQDERYISFVIDFRHTAYLYGSQSCLPRLDYRKFPDYHVFGYPLSLPDERKMSLPMLVDVHTQQLRIVAI